MNSLQKDERRGEAVRIRVRLAYCASDPSLGGHPHTWHPPAGGLVIDLDALPPGQAVAAAVDRVLHMRHGEQIELQSGADISPVWRGMDQFSPKGYRFIALGRAGALADDVTRHRAET